jgi:hypothetical protein
VAADAGVTTVELRLPRLHDAQRQVLAEADRRNVVQCGRRWGKTTLGVDRMVTTALDGLPAAWFAPTYRMQAEVWRELMRLTAELRRAGLVVAIKSERRLEFATGGVIELWSLDDPDAGRGRAYATIVVDEAAYVRNLLAAWDASLRAMLTDYRGTAWFLSTPHGMDDFQQLFLRGQQGREGWASWRMPTTANPHIPVDEVELAERELPAEVFAQEYLGIPAPDAANPFGADAIRDCCTLDEPTLGTPAAWGVDLAKSQDWTVALALDDAGTCTHLQRWRSDWRNTTARLQGMLQGVPSLVDSTGVGDPIVEELARRSPYVQGFKFTATSRQQLMEGLAVALQRRAVRVPRAVLQDELLAFRFDYSGGRVRYAAPNGVHDDAVMALALAVRCRGKHAARPLFLDVPDDLDDLDDDWS